MAGTKVKAAVILLCLVVIELSSCPCDGKRVRKDVFKRLRDATPEPGRENEFDMVQRPVRNDFNYIEFMRNRKNQH
ncbi:unnamed protein product [Dicrocoelium dendriticum]|nr:unnamed protein product [Dicrocoelium dendriticum]